MKFILYLLTFNPGSVGATAMIISCVLSEMGVMHSSDEHHFSFKAVRQGSLTLIC